MISVGIDFFTSDHAIIVGSAAQMFFDTLNPAAAAYEASLLDDSTNEAPSVEDKQKMLLKRKLFLLKNTNYEDDEEDEEPHHVQTELIDQYVIGLGMHATFARHRILGLRKILVQTLGQGPPEPEVIILQLRKSIDAFLNCVRCLVHIGETAVRRLPNNPRAVGFCSRLVLAISQMFFEPSLDYIKGPDKTYFCRGKSLIVPNRYAETISDATRLYREHNFPPNATFDIENESVKQAVDEADAFLRMRPGNDVRDLIHCLFSMDLVDVSISRCGYGDIQVWWGFPVSPLDPLLFFATCNSPEDSSLEAPWVADEVCTSIMCQLFFILILNKHMYSLVSIGGKGTLGRSIKCKI